MSADKTTKQHVGMIKYVLLRIDQHVIPIDFIILDVPEDDKLSIYIKDYAGDVNLIDAGIIMYYIDELGKTISSNSKWDIKPVVDGKEYTYIASKNL